MSSDKPTAGEDYPARWSDFEDWFASEDACAAYLEQLRWPSGFVCPACGVADDPGRTSRGRLSCRACRYQCSVTAGTIFDKTRTPLRVWFAAAWYITSQKQGISALGLQRVLGLTSYETAWAMLHRFRRAMVRPDRDLLTGTVEVDESFLALRRRTGKARKTRSSKSHNTEHLVPVVIAVEVLDPKGFGRIRVRRIDRPTIETMEPFIHDNVEPIATVQTDGSAIYKQLAHDGMDHDPRVQLGSSRPAHASLPGVHRVASLLKRWLLGTHHGAVDPKHVDYYLDEFVFRFNRRSSRSRGLLFYRLMQQAAVTAPVTYSHIRDNEPGQHRRSPIPATAELSG
ncbi:MAG: IS1595 family transposase [Burkholderiaceae bacterium]|nr:IS1595 family transposase [Burkholderiaceae bacterium]